MALQVVVKQLLGRGEGGGEKNGLFRTFVLGHYACHPNSGICCHLLWAQSTASISLFPQLRGPVSIG